MNFADVISPISRETHVAEIRAGIDAAAVAAGAPPPTPDWSPETLLAEVVEGVALGLEMVSVQVALYASGATRETAEGDVLTVRCIGIEGVTRREAQPATGILRVFNASGAPFVVTGGVTAARGPRGVYTATASATIADGASGDVPVAGSVPGTSEDAPAGTVTALVSPVSGVAVTNPAAIAGLSRESDPELRYRASLAPIARQPSTTSAKLTAAALDVLAHGVNVSRVAVRRIFFGGAVGIRLLVAKNSGGLSLGECTALRAALLPLAGDVGGFEVVSAVVAPIVASLRVYVPAADGRTDATIAAAIAAAIAEDLAACPIGGYLLGGAHRYPTERITRAALAEGATAADGEPPDRALGSDEIPTDGGITVAVTRI